MIVRQIGLLLLTLGPLACATPHRQQPDEDLPRAAPGVLYAIGESRGKDLSMYQLDEDEVRELARGFADAALRKPYAAPLDEDSTANVSRFHEQRLQVLAGREELAGAPVLEAAAREPGAVRTDSGMVLRVIESGSGTPPTIWDFVRINYHGTQRDGTVFHSNQGREPVRIRLGATTRCWQQAFTSMAPGARLHVVCPPSLAYGWAGWPGMLPGGAVVTYDLELLSVEKMPEPEH